MKKENKVQEIKLTDSKIYQTQYILNDGSMIFVSDKYGKTYMQHGKCVPTKNHRVLYRMNQELNNFLKKQGV